MRPRARVWLPKMLTKPTNMLELLQVQNSSTVMDKWSVMRAVQFACLVIGIDESGSRELEKACYKLFFGCVGAKVKVFRPPGPGSGKADEVVANNSLLSKFPQEAT